jgi:hypothetical protein
MHLNIYLLVVIIETKPNTINTRHVLATTRYFDNCLDRGKQGHPYLCNTVKRHNRDVAQNDITVHYST